MTETVVLVERDDGLATVTLNRPEALNAMSSALRASLVETFNMLAEEDEIGVVWRLARSSVHLEPLLVPPDFQGDPLARRCRRTR